MTQHLDPERAAAYLEGALDATERERVARHLEDCAECAELVLDLDTLAPEEPADPDVVDLELRAARRAFEAKLEARPAAPGAGWSRRWSAGLAALFALVSIGLGLRVAQLERVGSAAQANVPIAYLDPVRGDVGAAVEAPAEGVLLLVLTPSAVDPSTLGEEHRVRVFPVQNGVETEGDEALVVGGLRATDLGTFRVAIPASALPPGDYRVRLEPARASPEETLATDFLLRVNRP